MKTFKVCSKVSGTGKSYAATKLAASVSRGIFVKEGFVYRINSVLL